MTLTEFLTARLDEDEAAARAATEGPWFLDAPDHAYVGNRGDGRTAGLWAIVHMSGDVLDDLTDDAQRHTLADAAHIARHDPARVLREVEAKRALVSDLRKCEVLRDEHGHVTEYSTGELDAYRSAAWWLAAAYADHPDYSVAVKRAVSADDDASTETNTTRSD